MIIPGIISYEEFARADIRSGTIVDVRDFPRAKNPSFKIYADFGPVIGIVQTSAQVTVHYSRESLIGRKIIGCLNLGEKNIAGFTSQFLLLGFSDEKGAILLAGVDEKIGNGQKLL